MSIKMKRIAAGALIIILVIIACIAIRMQKKEASSDNVQNENAVTQITGIEEKESTDEAVKDEEVKDEEMDEEKAEEDDNTEDLEIEEEFEINLKEGEVGGQM